jgi:hypothetical protein
MTPATAEPPVVKDAVWQAWIEKGIRHDRATARKIKVLAGIFLPLAVLGIALYLSSVK